MEPKRSEARVSGNPDSIGRFSSTQVRPGPPYDISNPAGATKFSLFYKGFRNTIWLRLTEVQQPPFSFLADEPAEGVRRVGVSVRVRVQTTLGRDSDRGVTEAAAFSSDAFISLIRCLAPDGVTSLQYT